MTSLAGLESLMNIEGGLNFSSTGLIDLSGLTNLNELNGEMIIQNNDELISFEGLEKVKNMNRQYSN